MTTNCKPYCVKASTTNKTCSPNIEYHVFISKATTKQLSNYIVAENWGKDERLLYKYLDYIWRFQLIDKQVKQINYQGYYNLIFNTGLYKRNTNEEIYLILFPNNAFYKKSNVLQKWRVAFSQTNEKNDSFMTKSELIKIYNISINDIPLRTNYVNKTNINDLYFHNTYSFVFNTCDRVRTGKDRIMRTIKNDTSFKGDINDEILGKLINDAILESLLLIRNNPELVIKQMFIERGLVKGNKITTGYHMELILPLTINILGEYVYFALILRADHENKKYEGMSVITREMAYLNARLIDYVNISWLSPFVNSNKISKQVNINNTLSDNNPFFYIYTHLPLTLPKII